LGVQRWLGRLRGAKATDRIVTVLLMLMRRSLQGLPGFGADVIYSMPEAIKYYYLNLLL